MDRTACPPCISASTATQRLLTLLCLAARFLRRVSSRMGTPGKLKCLRSAFTRNLVLPSLKGSVPDTKAAKVGGRTLTCVTYRMRLTWRPCAVP